MKKQVIFILLTVFLFSYTILNAQRAVSGKQHTMALNKPGTVKAHLNHRLEGTTLFLAREDSLLLEQTRQRMSYPQPGLASDTSKGNYSAGFSVMPSLKTMDDKYHSFYKLLLAPGIKSLYKNERAEEENVLLKKEQEKDKILIRQQRNFTVTVFLFLSLAILIALLFYVNNKQQRKAMLVISKKNKEILENNRQISEQNKELKRLHHVKDKLFTLVSHDMRSPLVQLDSLLSLLQDDDITNDNFKVLTNGLWKDLKNTTYILDNLLFWAKNQMSGIKPVFRNINLAKLIRPDFELMKQIARQKDIDLTAYISQDIYIYAEAEMIRLVIRNLVSNAIKFTPRNGNIRINAFKDNGEIRINVTDNGLGIKEEEKQKILVSADMHYTRRGTEQEKGNGIGLILCKDFVEKNNGRLQFKSEPGKGTSFFFTVPVGIKDDVEITEVIRTCFNNSEVKIH